MMAQRLRILASLAEDSDFFLPAPYMVADTCMLLQFQGTGCPLWTLVGPSIQVRHMHICSQITQTHKVK